MYICCRIFVIVTLMTTAIRIHAVLKLVTVYEVHGYVLSNPHDRSLIYYVML